MTTVLIWILVIVLFLGGTYLKWWAWNRTRAGERESERGGDRSV
jgi:threonine/homoserine/homoserine lactone efflux protein